MTKKIGLLGIFLVVALVATGAFLLRSTESTLPNQVKSKLNFAAYYPSDSQSGYQVNKDTIKVITDSKDKDLVILSLVMASSTNKITLTQQAYPDILIFDKFVNSFNPYGEVQSRVGKVTLTHPKELKGGQTAITVASGTLIFARPEKDLSEDDWRKIFNSLDLVR